MARSIKFWNPIDRCLLGIFSKTRLNFKDCYYSFLFFICFFLMQCEDGSFFNVRSNIHCTWMYVHGKHTYIKPLLDPIVTARILLWISHTDHWLILKQGFTWAVARTHMRPSFYPDECHFRRHWRYSEFMEILLYKRY